MATTTQLSQRRNYEKQRFSISAAFNSGLKVISISIFGISEIKPDKNQNENHGFATTIKNRISGEDATTMLKEEMLNMLSQQVK